MTRFFAEVCRGIGHVDFGGNDGTSDMHFTWPAWDKTHVLYAELAKLVSVALALFSAGTPAARQALGFCVGKSWTFLVSILSFRVACVGQNTPEGT